MIRRLKVEAFGNDPSEIEYDAIEKARAFFGNAPLSVGDYDVRPRTPSSGNLKKFVTEVYVTDHRPEESP